MKKRVIALCIVISVFCLVACGQEKTAKPYMGGHFMGDKKQTVESRGNAEEVLGIPVYHWIYLYTTEEVLKGVVYEAGEEYSLEEVVEVFEGTYGEGTKGFRGENQEYTEYSWVDEDSIIYVMKKNDEGNVIIQISGLAQ